MKAIHRKLLLLPDDDEDAQRRTTVMWSYPPRDFLVPPSTNNTPTTTTTTEDTATNTTVVRKHLRSVSSFDTSLALTAVVLLTALFFMGFFSVYFCRLSDVSTISRRRRRHSRGSGGHLTGPKFGGVDTVIMQSLPLLSYESEKHPLDCAVCLIEFEEKESVKMTPNCGHVFHPECIDKWLGSHASCPLCRSTQLLLVQEKKKTKKRESGTPRDASESTVANTLRVAERERDECLSSSSSSLRRTSSWASLVVVDKQRGVEGGVLLRMNLSM